MSIVGTSRRMWLLAAWAGMVAVVAAIGLGSGAANAAGTGGSGKPKAPKLPQIVSASSSVRAGEHGVVTANVGKNSACRLALSARRRTVAHSSYGASASGQLEG